MTESSEVCEKTPESRLEERPLQLEPQVGASGMLKIVLLFHVVSGSTGSLGIRRNEVGALLMVYGDGEREFWNWGCPGKPGMYIDRSPDSGVLR